jgi:hypothetical protein
MLGLPFPNLKLTYMPPRAKYEQNDLFANVDSLEFVAKSWLNFPSLIFAF